MPAEAADGIRRGMYRLRASGSREKGPRVQLLAAGPILREALAAAELLQNDFGVAADVWSVTSFTELRRDGMEIARDNRLHPQAEHKASYVDHCLAPTEGPVIAASDYVSAVADLIRPWVPRRYVALGTDGYGRSDTRAALRRFFEVDRSHIAVAALSALVAERTLEPSVVAGACARYGIETERASPWMS